MVLIGNASQPDLNCAGVIIAPHYALTTDFCAQSIKKHNLTITSGSKLPSNQSADHGLKFILDSSNDYGYKALEYSLDSAFAIVRVEKPFIYGVKKCQPVKFPSKGFKVNSREKVTAIGVKSMSSGDNSGYVHNLSLEIRNDRICERVLGNFTAQGCIREIDPNRNLVPLSIDDVPIFMGKNTLIGELIGFGGNRLYINAEGIKGKKGYVGNLYHTLTDGDLNFIKLYSDDEYWQSNLQFNLVSKNLLE
ncbi:hypothetical protein QAD02_018809 [Eretmocerus hayati]|uniref:Uncharacterized protein n=1 Tax=Eretmocerus hayati TaxID=131215 RepID=A0ACC2PI23_9HYME|nr:hypothetical protein QAD02_018809 [Eretmocerus hayati]